MSQPEDFSAPPAAGLSRVPFTPREERTLRSLANWMQAAAVINVIGGVFNLVTMFYPRLNVGKLIDAVVGILVGVWVFLAASAFRKVAATDQADQSYLVEGFTHLRRAFLLQSILVLIVLALICVVMLIIFVRALSH
ncbi:MAG TPA: DUF5362 family protein [Gemmataceae bacterium]|nr:DUF5362 family protein [Gemmataceae bacterium]